MVLPCSKDGNEDINYRREYGEPIPPSYNLDYVLVVVLQHLTLDNSIAPPFNLDKAKKNYAKQCQRRLKEGFWKSLVQENYS